MQPINKINKFSDEGQALTELAIFGSIFLFCTAMLIQYGLEANYQQQVQMEAFRKAQQIAFHKSGPNSAASLILVKDKLLPDPRDQLGFAERYPIVGGANVTWDTNLSAQYVNRYDDEPEARDLPAMYFEVDRAEEVPSQAMAEVPSDAGQDNVFGFYTARFEKAACPEVITVVLEDLEHRSGREYRDVTVNCADIRIMRLNVDFGSDPEVHTNYHLLMYPYFRDERGVKRKITLADLDGDGKLENIIAASPDKELLYINYHSAGRVPGADVRAGEVQIDTDYVNASPSPYGNASAVEDKQGMIQDFTKTIVHTGSRIDKNEAGGGGVTSSTTLNARQVITHKIRLNNGQVIEIPADFEVRESDLYNWNR